MGDTECCCVECRGEHSHKLKLLELTCISRACGLPCGDSAVCTSALCAFKQFLSSGNDDCWVALLHARWFTPALWAHCSHSTVLSP